MASLAEAGVEVLAFPERDGRVYLRMLLKVLGDRGVISVLVEGGGKLLGSLFDLGLVDKVAAFIAPTIIGGREAPSPVAGTGVESMGEALRLSDAHTRRLGRDILITGYVQSGGNECSAES